MNGTMHRHRTSQAALSRMIAQPATAFLILGMTLAPLFAAAPPQIGALSPRGGQRGTDVAVTISGARLDGPLDLMTYEPGITVAAFEPLDAGKLRCTMRIAADARLGLHTLRLRTTNGLSNLRLFGVSNLPEITEVEPNPTREQAQVLALPACVNGVILPEDMDVFAVAAEAGQTLALEIEGLRLGDTLFDPRLAILDPNGVEWIVADDIPLVRQDAALVVTFPSAGTYFVHVRETAYGGGPDCAYRLHAGAFPRPTACTPSGAQAGSEANVTWIGDPTMTSQSFAATAPGWLPLYALRDGASSPSALPFRVCEFPTVVETEPNNESGQATPMLVPGGASGVLAAERDVDCFVFDAVQGQALEARVYARALGSPVDSVLNVRRASGEALGSADDSGGPDSMVRFTCPAAEKVVVEIRDLLLRHGADFTYFLEITPVRPALSLTISAPDAAVTVAAGNRAAALVTANRADFGGPLKVSVDALPPGVSAVTPPLHESVGQLPIVFEAAPDAAAAGALLNLIGEHADPAAGIRGTLHQSIDLVKYENNPFYGVPVDRLALAVAQPAPFRIELVQPSVPLVRVGSMSLPVRLQRSEGFTGHVTVRLLWNPPGVGSGALELPPDKSEGSLPLNAAGNAALGTWPLVAVATTDGGGAPQEVSSQLATLRVAEPFVDFAVQKSRTEQGKPVELVVKLTQRTPFEGEIQAQLLGLPARITAPPLPITTSMQEIRFTLAVPADAPPGEHGGVFVHADLLVGGATIPHNSPPGLLIVDRPLPPKDPQQEAARQEAMRKAQEEKERKKAERLAALEARRAEAEARKKPAAEPEPPPPQPQP